MGGTRKLRLAAMATAMTLTATVVSVPMAWGTTSGAPADVADVPDSGIASTVAPVLKGNGSTARTYSQQEVQRVEDQGGDPAVLDYWTPERMASATSLDEPGDRALVSRTARDAALDLASAATMGDATVAESAPDAEIVTRPAAAAGATPAGKSGGVQPLGVKRFPISTGKLFIGGVNGNRYCSASALNTRSKRVVITAGHCVHEGRGGNWMKNVVFVPRYNGNASRPAPYGKFQARTLHTFKAWINYGGTTRGWGRDVGLISTYTNANNKRLVRVVGGNGLVVDKSYSFTASVFGYPSNLSNGEVMRACTGKAAKTRAIPHTSKIVGCNFGKGSSGGPWLWKYNGDTRLGYTIGVTSFGPSNNKFIGSPHFDVAVRSLAIKANNAF
ncbi:Trypsin [Promicromonospora umidemergens]|uniref:Peptidase n=1 Tax=Promicromonospora umidemergens TaxID=629679 RepID=A0ABP8YBS4_9MICO|nr:trypsin-like serine protease [Promicromonospora umidemergens]MCP2284693.1 Trypsin [Promicromonospora umidemergens]